MTRFCSIISLAAASMLLLTSCHAQEALDESQRETDRLTGAGKREAQPDFLRYDDEKFPISRNLRGRLSDLDTDIDEGSISQDGIWLN
jgi:hypothetical protein